jgi:NADPH:quinone reductase-like Zn-dependent oxidoreductase
MVAMKAVRFHDYQGIDALRYEDVERPLPAPGQCLIRVHAAGVNPVDAKVEEGLMRAHLPLALPHIAGLDFSGTIEEGVLPGFGPGDEVFGRAPLGGAEGSYAEFVVAGADDLAAKPRTVDHEHAAAIPTAALAAWQALFDSAGRPSIGLKPGQSVLIHGASGGVGLFAVQLARWAGARVFATARAEDRDELERLGAERVFDYRAERFEDAGELDAVLDTIGGETQRRSLRALRPGGVLASLVGLDAAEDAEGRGVRALAVMAGRDPRILAEIARLVDEGRVEVRVAEVLPLARARDAQRRLADAHVRGKVVLTV